MKKVYVLKGFDSDNIYGLFTTIDKLNEVFLESLHKTYKFKELTILDVNHGDTSNTFPDFTGEYGRIFNVFIDDTLLDTMELHKTPLDYMEMEY